MRRDTPFRRLLRESLRFRGRLLLAISGYAAIAGGRLALTWLVKAWVEGPLGARDSPAARSLLGEAVVLTVGMFAALFASRALLASAGQRLVESLRRQAAARLLRLELSAARRLPAGEWLSRVFNDAGALAGFAEVAVKRLLGDGLVAIGAIAAMFWLDFRLALAVSAVVPLAAALLGGMGRSIRRRAALAQRGIGASTALLSEQIQGLSTIKGFGAEAREEERFAETNAASRRQMVAAEAWSSLLVASVFLATGLGLLAAIAFGTRQILAGRVTQGALLAFCLYAVQAIEPMRRLSDVHALLQRALAAAERVFEAIDLGPAESGSGRPLEEPVRGALAFEHVSFRYAGREPVLEDLSFRLAPGEAAALVSASGEGKTTVARLLQRLESPASGRIVIDGVDAGALRLDALRLEVCVVEQDAFLFSGTLLGNVRYGRPEASRQAAIDAAERAGLGPLAAALPAGWDAPVAECGRDLSGGERQRVALARAVLRDPAILVLDEATSALDEASETAVFEAFAEWLAGRTVLAIAHRRSTVARFARVIVLEEGRVAADGPPESVFAVVPEAFVAAPAGESA
ncbi:MAG TPA: ABC transporter ATP-binding protein [Thermoanaerobaculia bacterium]|nr:ABC transporter ATP-binding protein [Thermoanaerobaculia bacterium]